MSSLRARALAMVLMTVAAAASAQASTSCLVIDDEAGDTMYLTRPAPGVGVGEGGDRVDLIAVSIADLGSTVSFGLQVVDLDGVPSPLSDSEWYQVRFRAGSEDYLLAAWRSTDGWHTAGSAWDVYDRALSVSVEARGDTIVIDLASGDLLDRTLEGIVAGAVEGIFADARATGPHIALAGDQAPDEYPSEVSYRLGDPCPAG